MRYILCTVFLVSSYQTFACQLRTKGETRHVFPAMLSVPRDLPVGGVIYDTQGWVGTGEAYVNCGGLFQHYMGTGFTSTTKVPGMSGVYTTSLDGIGIKVAWANSLKDLPSSPNAAEIMQYPRNRRAIGVNHYTPAQRWWIQLIKTKPSPESGVLTAAPARIYYDNELTNELIFTPSMVVVNARSCRLGGDGGVGNINVKLDPAPIRDFTGVGSTSTPKAFRIPLNCDPEVRVSYTISGLHEGDGAVLKNTLGAGMARGIGVQLLKAYGDDGAVVLGRKTAFGDTGAVGGSMPIPLVARYYQTEPEVTPGEINILGYLTLYYE